MLIQRGRRAHRGRSPAACEAFLTFWHCFWRGANRRGTASQRQSRSRRERRADAVSSKRRQHWASRSHHYTAHVGNTCSESTEPHTPLDDDDALRHR